MNNLDPMLPPTSGSEADRILRDHRAMDAMRKYPDMELGWIGTPEAIYCGFRALHGVHWCCEDDPADAILACAAAIEAASRDSDHRQA